MISPVNASDAWLGPASALLSSFTWAIGTTAYSRVSRHHSAFAVNFTRAAMGFPFFVLMAFILAGGWNAGIADYARLQWTQLGWFTLSMFASYAFGDVLFMWSTRSLGVPGALAIASCYPLWTAFWGILVRGEALSRIQGLGLFVTVLGVVTVILNGPQRAAGLSVERSPDEKKALKRGVILAVATSILWAVNSLAVSEAGRDLSLGVGNTVRMALAMILSAAIGRILAPGQSVVLPWPVLRKNFAFFSAEVYGGSCFYLYGLAHSPLAIGATLSSLAPVISVPVAWILGLERFSAARTLAVCLVVLGLWLLVTGGMV